MNEVEHPKAPARLQRCHRTLIEHARWSRAQMDDPATATKRAPEVSAWSVADHLEHIALAETAILDRLEAATLETEADEGRDDKTRGLNWIGRIALTLGRIPRGRGKAPAPFVPMDVDPASVADRYADIERRLEKLSAHLGTLASSRRRTRHPVFGHLRPAQWLRFLDVHHRHHARIVEDILRAP